MISLASIYRSSYIIHCWRQCILNCVVKMIDDDTVNVRQLM